MKIAALHNPQRSVGAALQFIGRFARSSPELGPATAVLARPDPGYDPELRTLYAERMQWDKVLKVLSESAIEAVRDLDEFDAGFSAVSSEDELSVATLKPKMSTVVYATECDGWQPDALEQLFVTESILAGPAINADQRVAWIVVERRTPVRWADLRSVENCDNHLHVLHWDKERKLLYINSSDLDSLHEDLAEAVCGEGVKRLKDEVPFWPLGEIDRPIPTNIGVLSATSWGPPFLDACGTRRLRGFLGGRGTDQGQHQHLRYRLGTRATTPRWARRARGGSEPASRTVDSPAGFDRSPHSARSCRTTALTSGGCFREFVRPQPLKERPKVMPLDMGWAWSSLRRDG